MYVTERLESDVVEEPPVLLGISPYAQNTKTMAEKMPKSIE